MAEENDAREAAIGRLKAKQAFRADLVSYVVINAFLIGIWALTGRGYFWPMWVLLGWGIGLVLHGWTVYGQKPITEDDVQREMERGDGGVA